jgi:hypothetical protein
VNHRHNDISFAAFSKEMVLSFQHAVLPNLLCERVKEVLLDLCQDLKENGCRFIGHIKVFLKNDQGRFYFFSATSFDQFPECKGNITEEISRITLTMNAIVYGLSESQLSILVNKKLQNINQFLENTKGG